MTLHEIRGEKLYPESAVVLQKRAQEVSLVPCDAVLEPRLRVLEGIEHVVKVHVYARREGRQNLEEQPVQIAACLGDMAAIHEQDVARCEAGEQSQIHVLQARGQQTQPSPIV